MRLGRSLFGIQMIAWVFGVFWAVAVLRGGDFLSRAGGLGQLSNSLAILHGADLLYWRIKLRCPHSLLSSPGKSSSESSPDRPSSVLLHQHSPHSPSQTDPPQSRSSCPTPFSVSLPPPQNRARLLLGTSRQKERDQQTAGRPAAEQIGNSGRAVTQVAGDVATSIGGGGSNKKSSLFGTHPHPDSP